MVSIISVWCGYNGLFGDVYENWLLVMKIGYYGCLDVKNDFGAFLRGLESRME